MTSFNRFVVGHPWLVIVAFTAATLAFAAGLPRLNVDFDAEKLFPPDHPEIVYNKWVQEYFGIDEPVVILVVDDGPHGVFTPETLALVVHLSEKMSVLDGVDGDDVLSLSEIDDITADGDSLSVEPFFEEPPATAEQAAAVRAAVFANPMMVGALVSEDGRATIVAADIAPGADKLALHAALGEIVVAAPHGSSRLEIAGRPIVESQITLINNREITRVMPIVIATAAAALALALHSVRGVILPLLVVLSSVIWTLGMMAWAGRTFSALNAPLPMMLVPIGIADGIHVIHHYMHTLASDPDRPNTEAVFETMQDMFTAVVMTSLTTAAGLLSLATSSLSTNRDFGYFSAFGTLAAMAFSLTVLPALLCVLPRPRRGLASFVRSAATDRGPIRRAVDAITVWVTERPRPVFGVTAVALAIAIAGLPMLTTDGSLLKNVPVDDPVRSADTVMVEYFGGSLPLEIVVDGGDVDAWKSPQNLHALVAFQRDLEALDGIGDVRSIADYIRRMNAVMNPDDAHADRIPDDRALISQYLLLYSISGEPDDFDDVVDYDYAIANVRAQAASDHSPDLARVFDAVDASSEKHLRPLGLDVHASGAAREIYEFVELIVTGQITSLALALLLVWLIASLMLRSIRGGLLTSLPVALSTIATFGGLGWIGEPIGVTTAILSAIAIGIGVDYAVHFVVRYRDCCRSGMDRAAAMHATLDSSGVAIFYNAMVVIAGFMAMSTSEFLPPRAMGLLVSWNMLICFLATITTLAALLAWLDPAFLRRAASVEPARERAG